MPPDLAPVIAIAGLILVKEAGVPIPVPGDLVVIGAGIAANRGEVDPLVALVAIVLASVGGGIVQYGLLRSVARPLLLRLLGRLGSAERVDRQTERLRRGGARSVALARSTPGVRIVAIAASALAGVPAIAFVGGLAIGNALFIGVGALAVIGGIGWFALGRWRRRRQPSQAALALSWADACCPACLAIVVLDARAAQ
jgi:membrane-associated protein